MEAHFGNKLLQVLALVTITELVAIYACTSFSEDFDVREHLSTATRYEYGMLSTKKLVGDIGEPPSSCSPIHINLVARHGTRAPTKKRIRQINGFAERIRDLGNSSLLAPNWMKDWKSPWHGRVVGGEVLQKGEEEMFELGQRIRTRYSEIFKEPYHPDLYMISATQVPRSAASAVAFGMGLFSGEGTLGQGRHRAFSVISDSRTHDIHLRFYESCSAYQESKAKAIPVVAALQEDFHMDIASSLKERFLFNITKEDIPTLWFLCKQEAAALDIVDRSCSLFTEEEVEMLEWADDLEVHKLKGYGESINYRMGIPLLTNVLESMERVIAASKAGHAWSAVEKAHLRFAHAETVIPFICLLGLFLDAEEVQKILMEAPLEPPPRPPKTRLWRGSAVAPYGANNMVVLHKCSSNKDGSQEEEDDFRVQVLHNERSVALPGCNGTHLCPFQVFKEQVVVPHLKYNFHSLCSLQKTQEKHDEL
nr:PHY1 [Pteris vittata]